MFIPVRIKYTYVLRKTVYMTKNNTLYLFYLLIYHCLTKILFCTNYRKIIESIILLCHFCFVVFVHRINNFEWKLIEQKRQK